MNCEGCGREIKGSRVHCRICSKRKTAYPDVPDYIIFNNSLTRKCPVCGTKLEYSSAFKCVRSEIKQTKCLSCASKSANCGRHIRSKEVNKKISDAKKGKKLTPEHRNKISKSITGDKNPMYGKSVYDTWIKKYGKDEADRKLLETKTKISIKSSRKRPGSNIGSKNPMYGRSVYDIWTKKYGRDEADKKFEEFKKKRSIGSLGENNPMFGKPSPKGSGNGWSGRYKGFYFRSLLELSYLKYLIDNDIKFDSGEKKQYRVEYTESFSGKERNYYPDFYLIDTREIIEIKPKMLINSKNNKDKFKRAKEIYGDKFKIITENDINKLSFDEIKILYISGELKWLKRYEEKFKERYL